MPSDLLKTTGTPSGTDSALYGLILENIDRAVVAFDQKGQITLFNPAAEALMERSSRQMIGQHYLKLFKARLSIFNWLSVEFYYRQNFFC